MKKKGGCALCYINFYVVFSACSVAQDAEKGIEIIWVLIMKSLPNLCELCEVDGWNNLLDSISNIPKY